MAQAQLDRLASRTIPDYQTDSEDEENLPGGLRPPPPKKRKKRTEVIFKEVPFEGNAKDVIKNEGMWRQCNPYHTNEGKKIN